MKIYEAVVLRFQEICKERGMKYNELARCAGITPSTIYSMMKSSRKDLSIITVTKLCDGLEISMAEFFTSKICLLYTSRCV